MTDDLQQTIHGLPTPRLLEQLFLRRSEYNPEALALMEREVALRGITEEEMAPYRAAARTEGSADNGAEEFCALDHTFSQTDILLAHAMLRDAQIPFFVDTPGGSSVVPLESEAGRTFTVHVPAAKLEQARALLEEHFRGQDGQYRLKHTTPRERLRAFQFSDVHMDEAQMGEEVEAVLTAEERSAIARYAQRLLVEAEAVEAAGRVLFYVDNLDELLRRLDRPGTALRLLDLATVLEVLQVYCDEEGFPPVLEDAAGALLEVFGA